MAALKRRRAERAALEPIEPVDVAELAEPVAQPVPMALELDGIVHVLTCGSVDDGKSTLIGRLLWDTGDVADDQREQVLKSAREDIGPDYSLLVDGLIAEREQGITIDIAWRYVDAGRRRLVIIDSPGHEQYTRNMASGASHADIAVMLVDARHGLKQQTRRHAAILDVVGVRHVVLAVNKMDLVDWSAARFKEIADAFAKLAHEFGMQSAVAIPVSARNGDNVVTRSANMPWYSGPTLVDELARVRSRATPVSRPFRFPVQTVVRAGDIRGLAGTITSGRIAVGDPVSDVLSSRHARVKRIMTMDGDLASAEAGKAIVLVLDTDLDIARGAVLSKPDSQPTAAQSLEARLVWLSDRPLSSVRNLLLRTATDLVPIANFKVTAKLDLETLAPVPHDTCQTNDIAEVSISLARPVALDRFMATAHTGVFVVVDPITGGTVAGGVAKALWSTVAASDKPVFRLTKEHLAAGLCAGLKVSDPEFQRRAVEAVRLIEAAGIGVRLDLQTGEAGSNLS
jgi:bifunctional enzyme CysN/CysC